MLLPHRLMKEPELEACCNFSCQIRVASASANGIVFPGAANICVRNALIYRKCIRARGWKGPRLCPVRRGLPWMSHGSQRPVRGFRLSFASLRQPEGMSFPVLTPSSSVPHPRHIYLFPKGSVQMHDNPDMYIGVNTPPSSPSPTPPLFPFPFPFSAPESCPEMIEGFLSA